MKRNLILLLVILFLLSIPGCAATDDPNAVYLPLRVMTTFYDDDNPSGRSSVLLEYHYDADNHLQSIQYQNYYGIYHLAITTDDKGNVLTCDGNYQTSNDLILGIHESYTYTQDGKLLVSKAFSSSDSGTILERIYNSDGLLTRIKRTRKHPSVTHNVTMECAHDENGNIISIHNYRVNAGAKKLYSVTEFTYDEQNRRTQEVRYNGNGVRTCSIEYGYKNRETTAIMKSFTDDGQLWNTRSFTFDHAGNLIESQSISDTYQSKTIYRYDYKKVPLSSAPENVYVYHNSLPKIGISDWYDLSNVDP